MSTIRVKGPYEGVIAMDDKQIIELYWERNTLAIDRTMEKYGNYCSAIARNILGSEEDAEECVNDTWLGAWNSIPPKRPEHLPSFLGKLTRYKAIDCLRAQHREKRGGGKVEIALDEIAEIVPADFSLEQNILDQELVQAINRFLAGLPKEARMIFMLRYWFFADIEEISARFGFSYSKVKSILHRTRSKLRLFLQKEDLL